MEDSLLYAKDSNKALKLRLCTTNEETTYDFSPTFTYPIFGEQEIIYGYRDLVIKLYFTSGSLKNYLSIEYSGEPLTGDKVIDIEKTLYDFIPPDYTKDKDAFEKTVAKDEKSFKPFGRKIGEYARRQKRDAATNGEDAKGKGKAKETSAKEQWENCDVNDEDAIVFEAYQTRFDTKGFKEYHRRMQIFVLLYIEGGSYIDEDDDRWEFVTLYEKRKSDKKNQYTYHFVGYTSLYAFLHWPDKTRLRLAQFVILPPYQGAGHGCERALLTLIRMLDPDPLNTATFYSLVYLWLLQRPDIAELTIEDPSEAFQDMRDKVDYRTLTSANVFKPDLKAPIPLSFDGKKDWREETRKEWKLASRQFSRILEMVLKKNLMRAAAELTAGNGTVGTDGGASPNKRKAKMLDSDEKEYRLLVKERLARMNYEILAPMSRSEKREVLQQTYESCVDEYLRLLDQMGEL